jgi:hypothetical protein
MARTDILLDPDNIDAITADGSFTLSTTVEHDPDIRLIPKRARLVLGGRTSDEGSTPAGEIRLATSDGEERARRTVNIHADGGGEGGEIRLSKSTELSTVIIDGGTGTMVLGASTPGITRSPETENGELWLDDGTGKKFGLKAENGTVGLGPSSDSPGIGLVLKPEEGVFGIVDENGNFVFRVNTSEKKLEILQEYQQDVLDRPDPREP